jgi:hypothetical protein
MKDKNVIKRTSQTLIFTGMRDTNFFKKGDCLKARKNHLGEWEAINNNTLEKFTLTWGIMHNPEILRLDMQWEY